MSTETKFVIVVPGKVAYTSPQAKEKFTSKPKMVIWNNYLEELLTVHQDIQVIDPREYLAKPKTKEAVHSA
jgi:hypothetical protein